MTRFRDWPLRGVWKTGGQCTRDAGRDQVTRPLTCYRTRTSVIEEADRRPKDFAQLKALLLTRQGTCVQMASDSTVCNQMMSASSLSQRKKAEPSVVLRAFLELIDANAAQIRSKAELH